ncbi:MAG: efflux RND transporter periplasmic adaptor subunit [Sphingobacteriales bacterium]|nr:MAG: efflux RND transporter periplasmic adaptor subunit [Sphingobacteriales bacterium]
MDKPIEEEVTARRKKKRILIIATLLIVVIAAIFMMRTYIKPSLSAMEIISAVAAKGDIENTINATGEILPEFEEILTSPINAAVREVLMDPGTKVKAGQSILALDKSAAQTEYEKLSFQIESKVNEISKLKLDLQKSFYDIKSSNNIKQLRIANFDYVSVRQP